MLAARLVPFLTPLVIEALFTAVGCAAALPDAAQGQQQKQLKWLHDSMMFFDTSPVHCGHVLAETPLPVSVLSQLMTSQHPAVTSMASALSALLLLRMDRDVTEVGIVSDALSRFTIVSVVADAVSPAGAQLSDDSVSSVASGMTPTDEAKFIVEFLRQKTFDKHENLSFLWQQVCTQQRDRRWRVILVVRATKPDNQNRELVEYADRHYALPYLATAFAHLGTMLFIKWGVHLKETQIKAAEIVGIVQWSYGVKVLLRQQCPVRRARLPRHRATLPQLMYIFSQLCGVSGSVDHVSPMLSAFCVTDRFLD
ncbi:unnamed protein product [Soboliphyme baturini]|uniref:Uncharacterized protein n=1 Tax=Soboliphyme baturini TaxID=241478 RepID=A0A183IBN7_9BILA|nr:unnamed protein product [Soboliphyme baturini]